MWQCLSIERLNRFNFHAKRLEADKAGALTGLYSCSMPVKQNLETSASFYDVVKNFPSTRSPHRKELRSARCESIE